MVTDELRANPKWRLDVEGEHLIVSAGADEVYVVDEASSQALPRLLVAYEANRCASLIDDAECGAAVRQLRRLGALIPAQALTATAQKRAGITWLGEPCLELVAALAANGWHVVQDTDDSNLQLLVRTNASWSSVLALYQQRLIRKVHLLIDLAYHHTICIGPLVVPAETACIACMAHRLVRRWGDLPPPQAPTTLQRAAGLAALLADSALLSRSLVERSVAINISELRLQSSVVFPTPGCSVCAAYGAVFVGDARATDGKLPLPWA